MASPFLITLFSGSRHHEITNLVIACRQLWSLELHWLGVHRGPALIGYLSPSNRRDEHFLIKVGPGWTFDSTLPLSSSCPLWFWNFFQVFVATSTSSPLHLSFMPTVPIATVLHLSAFVFSFHTASLSSSPPPPPPGSLVGLMDKLWTVNKTSSIFTLKQIQPFVYF